MTQTQITAGSIVTMTNRRGETTTHTVLLVHAEGTFREPMADITVPADQDMLGRGQRTAPISQMTLVES